MFLSTNIGSLTMTTLLRTSRNPRSMVEIWDGSTSFNKARYNSDWLSAPSDSTSETMATKSFLWRHLTNNAIGKGNRARIISWFAQIDMCYLPMFQRRKAMEIEERDVCQLHISQQILPLVMIILCQDILKQPTPNPWFHKECCSFGWIQSWQIACGSWMPIFP